MDKDKVVILIDGHSLAYRSYFALERTGMRNKNKMPTWAVYGFLKSFFDLISRVKPDAIAVSFDVSKRTFRTEKFEDYKANRPSMPDDMRSQMGMIRQVIETLNIPIYEQEGYEADDVIGTLARKIVSEGHKVKILTGDQDSFQLLDDDMVNVLLPIKGTLEEFNREKVHEKLGIYPEQLADYKGLCGDSSDNIPGIKGIGQKSAVTLLSEFQCIEEIYDNLDKIKKDRLKTLLQEGKDMAFLSKDLATIRTNIELNFDFKCCALEMPDLENFIKMLRELEFRTFLTQLPKLFKNFTDFQDFDFSFKGDDIIIKRKGMARTTAPEVDRTITVEEPETIEDDIKVDFDEAGEEAQQEINMDADGQTKLAFITTTTTTNPVETTKIIASKKELEELIKDLKKAPVFALDTETNSLNAMEADVVGISFSWQKKPTLKIIDNKLKQTSRNFSCNCAYLPLGHKSGEQIELNEALALLKPLLEDDKYPKVLHNAKYDMHVLKNYDIDLKNVIYDTILASYIDDPAERHNLKDLVMRKFQYVMDDYSQIAGTGKKKLTFDAIDIETIANYACMDAAMTLKLAHYYSDIFDKKQQELMYDMEVPLIYVLFEMERIGIGLDCDYLLELCKGIDSSIAELEENIYKVADYPTRFNINSPKQLGDVLFEHMKLPAGAKTKTKTGYSTSSAVLVNLATKYNIARLILDYRHLVKLKNTYIDTLPKLINKKTKRIHTTFNQTATTTGRLSSSDPNLQNIPIRTEIGNKIRKAFIPGKPDEDLLFSADYSQIELRILAEITREPNLVIAFKEGRDIHADTAAKVFEVDLKEVNKDMRRIAKAVNFGIIYGQSAYGLSETVGITPKEAKEFITKYFNTYPKVKEYMDKTIRDAHKYGYVETKFGRKRYLAGELSSRNRSIKEFAERAAINAPLQGTSADLIKLAMINLHGKLKELKLKSSMLLQVHDELVLEVPQDELEQVKQIVKDCMENVCKFEVPLVVDISTGRDWMEA